MTVILHRSHSEERSDEGIKSYGRYLNQCVYPQEQRETAKTVRAFAVFPIDEPSETEDFRGERAAGR
jgi:hypothetical protein